VRLRIVRIWDRDGWHIDTFTYRMKDPQVGQGCFSKRHPFNPNHHLADPNLEELIALITGRADGSVSK
jgi:hypothetical protein